MRSFTFTFSSYFLKASVYLILTIHVNLNTKLKVLGMYLNLINFMIEKVDLHSQVVPKTPKTFLITESSRSFKLKLKLIKTKNLASQSHWSHFRFSVVAYG